MNSKAGAVVERARQAEENLVIAMDIKAGNPVSVGIPQVRLKRRLSLYRIAEYLHDAGFTVTLHNHPKTKARWLDG